MSSIGISIILPTLNEGKNLEFLIPSIIRNLKPLSNFTFEIIVVDDCSVDNSWNIINSYGKLIKKIRLDVNNSFKNGGLREKLYEFLMQVN